MVKAQDVFLHFYSSWHLFLSKLFIHSRFETKSRPDECACVSEAVWKDFRMNTAGESFRLENFHLHSLHLKRKIRSRYKKVPIFATASDFSHDFGVSNVIFNTLLPHGGTFAMRWDDRKGFRVCVKWERKLCENLSRMRAVTSRMWAQPRTRSSTMPWIPVVPWDGNVMPFRRGHSFEHRSHAGDHVAIVLGMCLKIITIIINITAMVMKLRANILKAKSLSFVEAGGERSAFPGTSSSGIWAH